jgi:hypothetical protein
VRNVCMGTNCSRRRICTESSVDTDDTLLEWQLVTLLEEAEHQPSSTSAQSADRRLRSLSPAQRRWIRARIKIKLLRRFRVLWSRTGSWLNLHPVGTVNHETRTRASRVWASQGRAILNQFNTSDLFSPAIPTIASSPSRTAE